VNEAKRWFSAAELAELSLAGFPETKRGFQKRIAAEDWQRAEWLGTKWRPRKGRGGGVEYHYSVLKAGARLQVETRYPVASGARQSAAEERLKVVAAVLNDLDLRRFRQAAIRALRALVEAPL